MGKVIWTGFACHKIPLMHDLAVVLVQVGGKVGSIPRDTFAEVDVKEMDLLPGSRHTMRMPYQIVV